MPESCLLLFGVAGLNRQEQVLSKWSLFRLGVKFVVACGRGTLFESTVLGSAQTDGTLYILRV